MKLEYIRLHALVHLLMRFNLCKTFPLLTTKAYARLIRAIVLDLTKITLYFFLFHIKMNTSVVFFDYRDCFSSVVLQKVFWLGIVEEILQLISGSIKIPR